MTIRAPYFTFAYFFLYCSNGTPIVSQFADFISLVTSHMIKLKNYRIIFTAIYAWIIEKIIPYKLFIALFVLIICLSVTLSVFIFIYSVMIGPVNLKTRFTDSLSSSFFFITPMKTRVFFGIFTVSTFNHKYIITSRTPNYK